MVFLGVGILLIAAACWIGLRGADHLNLSPALTLCIGFVAGLGAVLSERRKPLLVISSLFLCLGLAESGVLVYQQFFKAPAKDYSYEADTASGWIAEHGLVGYAFRGPVNLSATATIGDETLYQSVPYRIDSLSRRPCEADPRPLRHALFFGGSFAFGEGLTNGETLGCQLQAVSDGLYASTTYAMLGWGPGQALVQLGVDSLFADIGQRSGIAVFSFVDDHIYRTTWKIDTASEFPGYPFFRMTDDGALDGPFTASDRPKLSLARDLFGFMNKFSPIFRNLVVPSWIRFTSDKEAVITTAVVLAEARQRYRARFDGEFVVLLWPRSRLAPELEELFIGELGDRGVTVVKVPPLPGDPSAAQLHPRDGHPSSTEVAWVARRLFDALTLAED